MQLITEFTCMQLHETLTPCAAVRSPQTVAYGVDVFALAGGRNTAVSVQNPAFNIMTNAAFDISFPYAVCPACPMAQLFSLQGTCGGAMQGPRVHALA